MYKIIFGGPADRFFRKLDKSNQVRLGKKILELESNPFLGKSLAGNFISLRSLRVGEYRIIYQIKSNDCVILVLKIGHRKNVYG